MKNTTTLTKNPEDFSEIVKCLKYDESSPTCLRWTIQPCRKTKVGDVAGCITQSNSGILIHKNLRFMVYDVVFYIHTHQIAENITFADGIKSNFSFSNLIESGKKKRKTYVKVNTLMAPIDKTTKYTWSENKGMILLKDSEGNLIRKFKNSFKNDEDFITNVRWIIVIRFGIAPAMLLEG